jgi:outer membrane protein TolC
MAVLLLQPGLQLWARPHQPPATVAEAINRIDFGVPEFRDRGSARYVFAEINLREKQLLELARWLTLDEAIEAALANNPDLAAAYSTIEGERWSVIAARRLWYPTLLISPGRDSTLQLGGTSIQSTSSSANPSANTTTGSSEANQAINTQLELSWTFFDQSRGPAINAAIGSLKAQRFLFDVAARNLVLDVQSAYYRLQEQMRLVDQYKVITLLTSLQLDQASQNLQQGRLQSIQIDQLRTTQRAELIKLIQAYVALFDVSVELSRLLALPGLTLVLASDASQSAGRWSDDVQTTVAHAEAFREEIQAQLQQSQSQRWRSSELLGAYWPKLALLGVGNLDSFGNRTWGSGGLSGTGSTKTGTGTVGVALNWSLFDGGIKAAEAVNRRIAAQTLDFQAASTRLQVSAQVRQSYTRYVGAMLALQNADDALKDSWNAFVGAIQLFEKKAINATTLIQTQAQLVEAITETAAAQRLQNTSLAELYRFSARWPPSVEPVFNQRMRRFRRSDDAE